MAGRIAVPIDRERIRALCEKYHIRRLSFFGSVLRDDFSENSDVDVLVEFEPGHTPGFFTLFDIEAELSENFDGRKVDVRTPEDLSRYFRRQVVDTMVTGYEAGR